MILSDNNSVKWRGKRRLNSRARAARVTAEVMAGSNLDAALPETQTDVSTEAQKDQSFIRAMSYGVLRDQRLLTHLANELLEKPLKSRQAEIMQLILVGLYQLRSMRVAPHAAVAETVNACEDLGQPRARGLVNAVLRRYQREAEALEAAIPEAPSLKTSHPRWLADTLEADWPEHWQNILAANQSQGPMVLRVNRRFHSRDEYLNQLQAQDIAATPVDNCPDALLLDTAMDVHALPGFADGHVSVQDSAAQLAAPLLLGDLSPDQPDLRVLDACAAPGGKTAHLLEHCSTQQITALDESGERLKRVAETLHRLQLPMERVTLKAADAADAKLWWDGQPFDRILLDAPCSGSGVIRRHPDIKWLRRRSDMPKLAEAQQRLLVSLWPLLKPGGKLLYATCSVLKTEGEHIISAFLEQETSAMAEPIEADWGVASGAGRAILPGPMDGFFYCLLSKAK